MATALLTACGGDSDSEQTEAAAAGETNPGSPVITPDMPITEQLALTFPKPKVEPGSLPGTAQAIEAGREACNGKTPVQVREEFIGAAENEEGLNEGQKEMVGEIAKFEKQTTSNFVAGQLAAGVYEATLPERQQIAGYRGCVYELALQARRELSKKKQG
jgi:hypothetical protein